MHVRGIRVNRWWHRWAHLSSVAALSLGLSLVTPVTASSQTEDEQIRRAMEQLGTMLGIAELSPEELQEKVESLSHLDFRTSVPIDFMTRDELAEYIRELFDNEYTPAESTSEELALRLFGFLDEDDDLRAIRSRVLNENIAGFYDEREGVKKLFAISERRELGLMNQLVLAHELRHALQDQHVDLADQLEVKSDFDDRRLSVLCLFEGDATLFMERYLLGSVSVELPGLAELLGGGGLGADGGRSTAEMFAGPALSSAPPIVQEQLIAPYLLGRTFVATLVERGGLEAVDRALADPPRSMEQVLYPDKYLARSDDPLPVDVAVSEGERVAFQGTLGELYVRVLLTAELGAERATQAARGWGGDRFAVIERAGNERLVWNTVWDSPDEADEFYGALSAYASAKFIDGYTVDRTTARGVALERRAP